jgi:maltooligosyltrehalose trehalohydrolase
MNRKTGAEYLKDNKTRFCVWAPFKKKVAVRLKDKNPIPLNKDKKGYWEGLVEDAGPGDLYKFILEDKEEFPDPASRSQPEGVHSWSQIVDHNDHSWQDDDWKGLPISKMIIYELHVGTFTEEGTFEAVIDQLDHLLDLGINTIEIMPISQFPGERNWGYDGVYPYAAQHSYGGAAGLKKMIDACHSKGIAVLLDAVYNHMGPEGNYLSQYGPYFTEKYQTPWGAALNFDDKHSDEVRNFFLQNALMWLEEFRFDGLRLDAIHEIIDRGARHLLKEMSQKIDELEEKTGRQYVLIAESDLNDTKVVNPYNRGGYALEGQWVDDFHHAVHTLLTGEKGGYYSDYGKISHLAKSFRQGFIYDGIYSTHRKRTIGNSPKDLSPHHFVVSIQNHDQIGNRMLGDRLSNLISFEAQKLAAGIMLTSPFVPMLYMGEEFAEDNPFQYFVSHGDPELVKAVQQGRKREFEYFLTHDGDFPDPQSKETFKHSKINWNFIDDPAKEKMFKFYKHLLKLRRDGEFESFRKNEIQTEVFEEEKILTVRTEGTNGLFAAFNFSQKPQRIKLPEGDPELLIASADKKWGGSDNFSPGDEVPGHSFILFRN